MKKVAFIRISEKTEKAIKVIVREGGYDLEKMELVYEKYIWIPLSVCSNIKENELEVKEWFYNKNIAVDLYGSFMKHLANS